VIKPDVIKTDAIHDAFEHDFCIGADHPSLPGHFPGAALVPGVMLLEQVAIALRAWRGQRLIRVLEAKFVAPLLPAEQALVRLTLAAANGPIENASAARIRFEFFRDDTLLARGTVEGAA
jgi:3-hydroxyacyl-[acyl-carrier-protein] dehydratase